MALPVLRFIRKEITKQVSYELQLKSFLKILIGVQYKIKQCRGTVEPFPGRIYFLTAASADCLRIDTSPLMALTSILQCPSPQT